MSQIERNLEKSIGSIRRNGGEINNVCITIWSLCWILALLNSLGKTPTLAASDKSIAHFLPVDPKCYGFFSTLSFLEPR